MTSINLFEDKDLDVEEYGSKEY